MEGGRRRQPCFHVCRVATARDVASEQQFKLITRDTTQLQHLRVGGPDSVRLHSIVSAAATWSIMCKIARMVSVSTLLRIVVARRRRLRSGNIRCHVRKVDFRSPRHPLRRVHIGKITDQTTQAKHMHCTVRSR
eukprot:SAG31_NODE_4282_length_3381_cov_2.153870_1_plen_134_part_00